ncbi:hypothetical protein [Ramlibacter sp.]|uniref:hypothetical protein n=1 Tax=Ramlibacter sp. TaxID=1917967 RepID=UPI003D13875F
MHAFYVPTELWVLFWVACAFLVSSLAVHYRHRREEWKPVRLLLTLWNLAALVLVIFFGLAIWLLAGLSGGLR